MVVTYAHGDLDRFVAAGVPVHCSAAEVPNFTGTSREVSGPRSPCRVPPGR